MLQPAVVSLILRIKKSLQYLTNAGIQEHARLLYNDSNFLNICKIPIDLQLYVNTA